jgi:hypothetical protein
MARCPSARLPACQPASSSAPTTAHLQPPVSLIGVLCDLGQQVLRVLAVHVLAVQPARSGHGQAMGALGVEREAGADRWPAGTPAACSISWAAAQGTHTRNPPM